MTVRWSDKKLIKVATEFRAGILGEDIPNMRCGMVSWPLAGHLQFLGVKCTTAEADLGWINHVWIVLQDGRVLDPTASQFNGELGEWPPVYLGPPDPRIHIPASQQATP